MKRERGVTAADRWLRFVPGLGCYVQKSGNGAIVDAAASQLP